MFARAAKLAGLTTRPHLRIPSIPQISVSASSPQALREVKRFGAARKICAALQSAAAAIANGSLSSIEDGTARRTKVADVVSLSRAAELLVGGVTSDMVQGEEVHALTIALVETARATSTFKKDHEGLSEAIAEACAHAILRVGAA